MYLKTNKPNRKGLNFNYYTRDNLCSTLVKLYDTNVLISDNNYIKLNSGGFKTNHTKNVINDFLPTGFKVYQKDFEWFVKTPHKTIKFEDNITIEVV